MRLLFSNVVIVKHYGSKHLNESYSDCFELVKHLLFMFDGKIESLDKQKIEGEDCGDITNYSARIKSKDVWFRVNLVEQYDMDYKHRCISLSFHQATDFDIIARVYNEALDYMTELDEKRLR